MLEQLSEMLKYFGIVLEDYLAQKGKNIFTITYEELLIIQKIIEPYFKQISHNEETEGLKK